MNSVKLSRTDLLINPLELSEEQLRIYERVNRIEMANTMLRFMMFAFVAGLIVTVLSFIFLKDGWRTRAVIGLLTLLDSIVGFSLRRINQFLFPSEEKTIVGRLADKLSPKKTKPGTNNRRDSKRRDAEKGNAD